jgi:hypothetical protein
MISEASSSFWKAHDKLTKEIQIQARRKYDIWKQNPFHPGLEFKCINASNKIWSVRVNDSYRAMGVRPDDSIIVWFWIGDHDEYMRLIK